MTFDECKNCKEYDFLDRHKCAPEWQAVLNEYDEEDDPDKAFGHDSKSAALKFADQNFADWEYPEEMEIWVRKDSSAEWEKFDITVESVPEFSATKKA